MPGLGFAFGLHWAQPFPAGGERSLRLENGWTDEASVDVEGIPFGAFV